MKNLFIIFSLIAFSCSEDQEPQARIAPEPVEVNVPVGSGCDVAQSTNVHTNGKTITISAVLGGCPESVVLLAETRKPDGTGSVSKYRQGATCDKSETAFSFAYAGETVYLGLFPCGGQGSPDNGRAYVMTITQNGQETIVKGKVGSTIKYVAK